MTLSQLVSTFLVIPGIFFLVLSAILCRQARSRVPDSLQAKWRALTFLIVFFIGGYILFVAIHLRQLLIPVEIVTGFIFFGGAVFVFLVIRLSTTTIGKLRESNANLTRAYDTTIEGWSNALELRDSDTQGHTQRVTELTLKVASAMGISEEEMVHVRRGALLHDIGKMAVPDAILMKPGPLTEDEQEIMRQHPMYAYNLLSPIEYLRPALVVPYCHHEWWDGSGYPRGLRGEQIPLAARIFAIADTWDALISERRYREAWTRDKVVAHIRSLAGSQFDPHLVDVFLANV